MKLSNQYFGLFGDSQTSTSKTNIIKKVEEPFEEEEVRNDKPNLNHTNSNQCVVCYSLNLKYKCPECEMRTCSLDCVNNHKLKFECSGKKNFSSYKKLSELDDVTFLKGKKTILYFGFVLFSFYLISFLFFFLFRLSVFRRLQSIG